MGRCGVVVVAVSRPGLFFQQAHVLVVVAIQAQQFPIAAVRGIVVVVVVFVVHRQLAQARAGKFAAAAPAYPRKQFERPLAVSGLARVAKTARFGNHAVEPGVVGSGAFGHVGKSAPCQQGAFTQELPLTLAGTGSFLGFFASLFLRCCPLAMIILLVVTICEICSDSCDAL